MGVTTAEAWTRALLDAGKAPETPTALIRRCSLPDQQSIRCRLDEVADRLTPASKFRPPVIVIVGPVTELAESMDWISKRPLFGQTILVTRPADQAEALAGPLRDLGATVLLQPAIEIGPPESWTEVDQAIDSLKEYDTIIFCSHNGVQSFLGRLMERGKDVRELANTTIAVVGRKTADSLSQYHLRADVVPHEFRAESLAKELASNAAGKRILIVRASRGKDVLAQSLESSGAKVSQVVAYSHSDVTKADAAILRQVDAGEIDWVTIASSATAESLHHLLGPAMTKMKIASLSPVTSATLDELGYQVTTEADPYTIDSLIESILQVQT